MTGAAPPSSLTRHLALIERGLRAAVGDDPAALHGAARYVMGWEEQDGRPAESGGKRIRPALALLAAEVVGGTAGRALPGAVAVELIHNFSLVHDEVQDRDLERHHRPTIWSLVGEAQAINVGDLLFTRAIGALAGAEGPAAPRLEALGVLNKAVGRMLRGQWDDLAFEDEAVVTVDDYLRMVAGKTGALLGASLEVGAILGGAATGSAAALGRWGLAVGLAFQVHDDYLGTWGDPDVTGKSNTNDIARRKKTLPIVHGLADANAAAVIRAAYAAPDTPDRVREVVAALEAAGSGDYCREEAARQAASANELLDTLDLSEAATRALRTVARYLINRSA